MTLEQYIAQNYKEQKALQFAEWVQNTHDKNNNGKIDTGERAAYNKALNARNYALTYNTWEKYVETIERENALRLQQLKTIWEASEAANGNEAAKELYKPMQLESQATKQAAAMDKKILIIGAFVLVFIILKRKK